MVIAEILNIVTSVLGYVVALIPIVAIIITKIKDKKWNELKEELKKHLIPLMEQAERMFSNPTEKEEWVIKKLSLKTHIDFYKYSRILALTKDIIAQICADTKTEINKTIVIQEKETIKEVNEGSNYTNGIS